MEEMQAWVCPDETARAMLGRVLGHRLPSLAPTPPLHRLSLRPGHVVEIVGPSGCAKSEILIQAAVTCILPREWKGVTFGGSEGLVMMFDLDCRFDILRLVHVLQCRINEVTVRHASQDKEESSSLPTTQPSQLTVATVEDTNELFKACLKRFYHKCCYNSFEFLATLKTIRPQLQRMVEDHEKALQLVLIDSIGAYYWLDRACQSTLPVASDSYRTLSLQVVFEAVVRELRQILQTHPFLLIASKGTIFSSSTRDNPGNRDLAHFGQKEYPERLCEVALNQEFSNEQFRYRTTTEKPSKQTEKMSHREYMPAVWQGFVTHRIVLQRAHGSASEKQPTIS
ncbi:hypothetical protein O6H91_13G072500 [Diphasiastrum complanatum]|uniref:Uncharacterized protein n=1 Tax=Diphasiastrum complanatum TaxID=34168 RepID=A0ACC2BVZ3_DIPCM|nr:hypothetical protein O6H91_13G072500 [Diphasiastrum complanatum]